MCVLYTIYMCVPAFLGWADLPGNFKLERPKVQARDCIKWTLDLCTDAERTCGLDQKSETHKCDYIWEMSE